MELDDLKIIWSEFDKKISDNIKLNEELLIKNTRKSARDELKSPLYSEILNLAVVFLGGVFIFSMSIKYIEEPRFSIPGFFSILIGLVYTVFSSIKINRIQSIDYIGSGIIKLQKDIVKLKKLFLQTRKYELILVPFIPVSILPIIHKHVSDIDVYDDIKSYIFEVLIVLAISIPIAIWFNKNFTDKKLDNANSMLEDIKKFEDEK